MHFGHLSDVVATIGCKHLNRDGSTGDSLWECMCPVLRAPPEWGRVNLPLAATTVLEQSNQIW